MEDELLTTDLSSPDQTNTIDDSLESARVDTRRVRSKLALVEQSLQALEGLACRLAKLWLALATVGRGPAASPRSDICS